MTSRCIHGVFQILLLILKAFAFMIHIPVIVFNVIYAISARRSIGIISSDSVHRLLLVSTIVC